MAQILLFGRFADIAGWRSRDIAVESLAALRATIARDYPEIDGGLARRGANIAVNQVIVRGDMALSPKDEVALFPPLSGG